jgi:hypothetical protein
LKRIFAALFAAALLIGVTPAFGAAASTADTVQTGAASLEQYTPEELLNLWSQIGDLLRANGTYPFVELEKGNTGYEVTALQTRLAELGYYHKEIVDYFGNGTYSAMQDFERANGLQVNGVASVADQQALFGSGAVASTGRSVTVTTSSSSNSSASKPDATSGATEKD